MKKVSLWRVSPLLCYRDLGDNWQGIGDWKRQGHKIGYGSLGLKWSLWKYKLTLLWLGCCYTHHPNTMKFHTSSVIRDCVCSILASVQCMCNLLTLQSDSTGGCYGFMDLLSKYFVWHSLIETTEECMVIVYALDTRPHDGHTMQL